MNQARIVIDATIDSKAINYRMFQAMGIGTLCFAEDDNHLVKELYNEDEIVFYNPENVFDMPHPKISGLVGDPCAIRGVPFRGPL